MKIGKSTIPRTAISTSDEHSITVRGEDLCRDLIGRISFTDYFSLLVTGVRPSAADAAVLDATLVAIAEHGMVPSVQASRMTYAAAPDALQGAVAAGILGCGSVILGASETAGRMFSEIDEAAGEGGDLRIAASEVVRALARCRPADSRLRPSLAQGARSARRPAVRSCAASWHQPALRADCGKRGGRHSRSGRQGPAAERVGRDSGRAARHQLSAARRCGACRSSRALPD